MNHRRHPRTLVEAFPQHEAWRGVVEHHKRPLAERVADVIFATVLGICGAALLVHFLAR